MSIHVAMQKMSPTVTEFRPLRPSTAAYTSTADTAAGRSAEQPRETPGSVPPLDAKMLEKAVKNLSQNVQNMQRSLQFSVDESSGRTVIKVVDKDTQEVIRQIPEEEVLALSARIEQSAGVLVKDEA